MGNSSLLLAECTATFRRVVDSSFAVGEVVPGVGGKVWIRGRVELDGAVVDFGVLPKTGPNSLWLASDRTCAVGALVSRCESTLCGEGVSFKGPSTSRYFYL